ncbi:uncharacterized protein BDR25DRAFT_319609 [Lindgomyces ingoldianus]|uniref:Uncharacterized protein n=1 Tax=Lindgomyces ingoldianus TaxID=673940 RepID=A0ACB6QAB7_9PLEO|nr:uncharacterized protein BDR25DRAFT_319609 [Lindgomyces ingoldianus]KAF2463869.1 hypothetical protein BDR25DRAFT_319609 [Lindgomyces ingoldianus]
MKTLSATGGANLTVCVAMSILAFIAVVLRFAVRKSLHQSPTPAEWLCVLSLGLFLGYFAVLLNYILNGSPTGQFNFILLSSPVEARNYMKMLFATEILFGAVITAVKMSILVFYHSIFSVSVRFTLVLIGAGTTCLVWFTTVSFVLVFQCSPIHAFWDMMALPPYCHSPARTLLGYEFTNLILDVTILCLPIGMIRSLHLPLSKKISITAIFLLGGFVCVASMVRLRYIWVLPHVDTSMNVAMVMIWSTVQLGLAIICCCLPTYGPVFALGGPIGRRFKRLYASFKSSNAPASSVESHWLSKKPSCKQRLTDGVSAFEIDQSEAGSGCGLRRTCRPHCHGISRELTLLLCYRIPARHQLSVG